MRIGSSVVRGNRVSWAVNFYDANNVLVTASAATLTVKPTGSDAVDIVMTEGADGWTAEYDTANTRIGIVHWHVECPEGCAQDGYFRVDANAANL